CPSPADADYFFPRGAFSILQKDFRPWNPRYHYTEDDKHREVGHLRDGREFYVRYLETTKEPPLWCGSPGVAESYRFLLVPSLRGEAACVRIERRGAAVRLVAALLSTTGGSIFESVNKKLEKADWDDLLARLYAVGFWESLASDSHGFDGEDWIVEG